jgi:hypothetical protein
VGQMPEHLHPRLPVLGNHAGLLVRLAKDTLYDFALDCKQVFVIA